MSGPTPLGGECRRVTVLAVLNIYTHRRKLLPEVLGEGLTAFLE